MFATLAYTALLLTIVPFIAVGTAPLWLDSASWIFVGFNSPLNLLGVAASSTVLWSSRHRGRHAKCGLALAALYIAPVFLFPFSPAIPWFLAPALLVFPLALFNRIRNRNHNPG